MSDLQQRVTALLERLVEDGSEDGVQAAVYRRGELVVDAAAGTTPDTLFFAASTVKGVTATVVHVLVERGVLTYDTPVADLWPEFGVHGKHTVTLRHVLTHSAGVPAVPADTTLELFCDWDAACAMIAGLEPWWEPGTKVGYHAVTFGFILGEVVRRATGKPISQVLTEEVAGPLGVAGELFFGVPETEHHRVARFADDPAGMAMFAQLPPDFPLFRSGPRELFPNAALANRPDVRRADIPAWGVVTARGIARMYAALLDEVDGVRLVSADRLGEITAIATTGTDELTGAAARYALGYTAGWIGQTSVSPTIFGMVGIGGSAAYADTATGLTVAVTKNRFNPTEINAFEQVYALVVRAFGH